MYISTSIKELKNEQVSAIIVRKGHEHPCTITNDGTVSNINIYGQVIELYNFIKNCIYGYVYDVTTGEILFDKNFTPNKE